MAFIFLPWKLHFIQSEKSNGVDGASWLYYCCNVCFEPQPNPNRHWICHWRSALQKKQVDDCAARRWYIIVIVLQSLWILMRKSVGEHSTLWLEEMTDSTSLRLVSAFFTSERSTFQKKQLKICLNIYVVNWNWFMLIGDLPSAITPLSSPPTWTGLNHAWCLILAFKSLTPSLITSILRADKIRRHSNRSTGNDACRARFNPSTYQFPVWNPDHVITFISPISIQPIHLGWLHLEL